MQSKALWQRASIAVTTLIMAGFGFTGLASADSISNTGPNSRNTITTTENTVCTTTNNNNVNVENSNYQTAVSGSVTVSDNTNAGVYWQGWSTLDPATWQANGDSYSSWWTNLTGWLAQHTDATQWVSSGQNTTWTPSGSNWQSTWANWDPATWQANGQTYLDWYTQLEAWMGSNSANWMMTWPASDTGSGGAMSGNATNANSTNFWVNINNGVTPANQQGQGSCGAVSTSSPGKGGGGGTISQTGPGSTNAIFTAASGVTTQANNTAVGVGNGNGQAAFSGHVSGHANTSLGTARSGNASNGNGTSGSVGVTSTPPSGGQGGGGCPPASSGASISNTGPGSSNSISSRTSSYSSVTNNNNVSIANSNNQSASSGSVTSSYNTTAGGGASGAAVNSNATGGDIDIEN